MNFKDNMPLRLPYDNATETTVILQIRDTEKNKLLLYEVLNISLKEWVRFFNISIAMKCKYMTFD